MRVELDDSATIVLPLRRSPLLPIFLIVSVDVLGLTIILPLLPFYAEHLGATPSIVGLLVSSYAFCQLIAGPLLGRLSDSAGRRPLLLVSQAGTFVGFLILANAHSLPVVFLSRIIDGLTAGNLSLAQAYIADVTEPENRARAFGIIGIAFGMGFLIGPGISGFLSQFSFQLPIYMAAALSMLSILGTYFLLPEKGSRIDKAARRFTLLDWRTYLEFFRRPELGSLLARFFVFTFAFATFISGFALFAERRFSWNGRAFGPKEVGYVYAYVGLLGALLQGGLIGRLVKRFGESWLVVAGFCLAMVGFIGLAFSYTIPLLLLVAALASIGTGVLRPALTSLITQKAERTEQGAVLGLNQSLMSFSQIVAPFLAGVLIDREWLVAWALLAAAFSAAGLML